MSSTDRQLVRNYVRLNAYELISRAVESGVYLGWNRAHKHEERPGTEIVCDAISQEVMTALCEVLAFDEGE